MNIPNFWNQVTTRRVWNRDDRYHFERSFWPDRNSNIWCRRHSWCVSALWGKSRKVLKAAMFTFACLIRWYLHLLLRSFVSLGPLSRIEFSWRPVGPEARCPMELKRWFELKSWSNHPTTSEDSSYPPDWRLWEWTQRHRLNRDHPLPIPTCSNQTRVVSEVLWATLIARIVVMIVIGVVATD